MTEKFADMFMVGGHVNSLGRVTEVIAIVLRDKTKLEEVYQCLFNEDAWVRMRAADTLEKICRQHPDWLLPYVDRLHDDLATSTQPSIQWHMAQIYEQVPLTDIQRQKAIQWLKQLLSVNTVDWIVSANAMDTLMKFTKEGAFPPVEMRTLLAIQLQHKSNAVIKRAKKHLATFE